jgi:hypothetical protein
MIGTTDMSMVTKGIGPWTVEHYNGEVIAYRSTSNETHVAVLRDDDIAGWEHNSTPPKRVVNAARKLYREGS